MAVGTIGIDDKRFGAQLPNCPDQGQDVTQRRAVDTQRDDLGQSDKRSYGFSQRRAVADMPPVPTAETDPGQNVGRLKQQASQDPRLTRVGDGLAGQQVGPAGGQQLPARPMKGEQLVLAQTAPPPILGAVGQVRAVGTDTGRNQRPQTANPIVCLSPKRLARGQGQLDRSVEQRGGLVLTVPVIHKAGQAGLIAGRENAVGTGRQVVGMHLLDGLGRGIQQAGRPQSVAQPVAPRFEFGGQPAVNNQDADAGQKRSER